MAPSSGLLADAGVGGPAPFIAVGLFFAGVGGAYGSWWLFNHPSTRLGRAPAIGLGAIAGSCFVVGTILPVFLGARPSLSRPATTGRIEIVSPTNGQVFRGDPATIRVELRLEGARIVPFSSLRLVPNEGHIHLYLDGSLVSMTAALEVRITASLGDHELRAEFVAVDHGPFDPRVVATASFSVRG